MKQTEKQVVFYSAEKDALLGEYNDRGILAFEAGFSEGLKKALSVSLESYEDKKTILTSLLNRLATKRLS